MRPLIALMCGLMLFTVVTATYAEDVWVRIAKPSDGAFVIGDVVIEAEVVAADPVEGVEFRVDGVTVGMVTSPPYRMQVDLGADSIAYRIEVIARSAGGGEARDSVTTEPVPIGGRIDVELQQFYVTVTDQGERVLDLRPEDFEVFDETVPQRLITFERGDVPLTAVLLIDSSSSMAGAKLQAAIQGATAFVENMEALDQVKVMFFSDRLLSTTQFSDAGGANSTGLPITRATGGTALFDYLFFALKLIEQKQGRRVIIVLSDGVDSHSTLDMEAVSILASRCQAQIHWIRLRSSEDADAEDASIQMWSAWRSASEYRRQPKLLKETVRRSGGDIHSINRIDQIQAIFLEILHDLREQYVLGYYPSNRRNDGAWHHVRVRVAGRGVDLRVAKGYIDY